MEVYIKSFTIITHVACQECPIIVNLLLQATTMFKMSMQENRLNNNNVVLENGRFNYW